MCVTIGDDLSEIGWQREGASERRGDRSAGRGGDDRDAARGDARNEERREFRCVVGESCLPT